MNDHCWFLPTYLVRLNDIDPLLEGKDKVKIHSFKKKGSMITTPY